MSVLLTTADRIKATLNPKTLDAPGMTRLGLLATALTAIFEQRLDRWVEHKARSQTFDVAPDGQCYFGLRGFPVSAVASVKFDATRKFAGQETTLDAALWSAPDPADDADELLYVEGGLPSGPRVLRVAYTGGMGTGTDAVIAAFPDLAECATLEAAKLFERGDTLAVVSQTVVGAQSVMYGGLKFSELTEAVLFARKRCGGAP